MTVDKRFALIAENDDVMYPYLKDQISTSRYGFALSTSSNPDRHGGGVYTLDIEEVVRKVVWDGWAVRAKTITRTGKQRDGSMGFNKRAIRSYWLAPELAHLVKSAKLQPLSTHPLNLKTTVLPESALDQIEKIDVAGFVTALNALEPNITVAQRAMLIGHAMASERTLSMSVIAALGGYDDYSAANIQYGKLGALFANHFAITGLENQTQAMAFNAGVNDEAGHWQWTLRKPLATALEMEGWTEPEIISSFEASGAELELNKDPKCAALPETVRRALVNARIGQGGYRKRMLLLWDGQCAVSGLNLETVLVASHAKAWSESTNFERLDKFNGLLLSASLDRLFDRGLISFAGDGRLLCKSEVSSEVLQKMGLTSSSSLRKVDPRHIPYLKAHQQKHGHVE